MRAKYFALLGAVVGIVAALGSPTAPVALAQGRGGFHAGAAPASHPNGGFVQRSAQAVPRAFDGRHGFPGGARGFRGDGRGFFRDHHGFRPGFRTPPVVVAPPVVAPVPVPDYVPAPVPVPTAVPVPVPVPALQAAVLPPLEQVLPAANFAQNPPQFQQLPDGSYALISPALFCSTDQVGTCQAIAAQLAQITPGWGTAVLNGPDGNGVYVTYQPNA
jgi:hypothetical protein